MAEIDAAAALEELLLLQHAYVNNSKTSKQDNSFENVFTSFQSMLLDPKNHEGSFWQLDIFQLISSVLTDQLSSCIGEAVDAVISETLQDPEYVLSCVKARVETSHQLQETLAQLQNMLKRSADLLKESTDNKYAVTLESNNSLASFWNKVQEKIDMRKKNELLAENQKSVDSSLNDCSSEILSFDENFMSRSATRISCIDNLPSTIQKMQSTDKVERTKGLNEFVQVPMTEILNSGLLFPASCSAIVTFFLDTTRAHRIVCDLMNQIEDAYQFLELFWAVLNFIGMHVESGELLLIEEDLSHSTDVRSILVLDCFRVLYRLLYTVMRHWIHFSAEALAQLLHSSFYLLSLYSKKETKAETEQRTPLTILFVLNDDPVRWLMLWLLNVPNLSQLFRAIDDSGFIIDLLQHLSCLQPLNPVTPFTSLSAILEKRTMQCMLTIVSYICEYQQGRDLLSQWQEIPALQYIRQRHTTWIRPALEPIAISNNLIYGKIVMPASTKQSSWVEVPLDDSMASCKILGTNVIDAIILSIATVCIIQLFLIRYKRLIFCFLAYLQFIVIGPIYLHEDIDKAFNDRWAIASLKSAATYLHRADDNDLVSTLLKIVDACWTAKISGHLKGVTEEREMCSWFPFRQPNTQIHQLLYSCLSTQSRDEDAILKLQASGQLLLQMILSSKAVIDVAIQDPDSRTTKHVFELCKRFLQSHYGKATDNNRITDDWICEESKLFDLIVDTALHPKIFKVAKTAQVIHELWNICTIFSKRKDDKDFLHLSGRIVRSVWHSARALDELDTVIVTTFLHTRSQDITELSIRELLGCLSNQDSAQTFFGLANFQGMLIQTIFELQASTDFTLALNSSDDECPFNLITPMRRLQWLQCCLSSHFACSSLLSMKTSPLIDFFAKMLIRHKAETCLRSCCAEDTCCVVFQLLLSLVSSVPSMLKCSSLLSQLNVIAFNDESTLQRGAFCDTNDIISPCSLVEKQLCYEYKFIGGPKEKLSRCELSAFKVHTNAFEDVYEDSIAKKPNHFKFEAAFVLQNRIFQLFQASSERMEIAEISQASWDLIHHLETQFEIEFPQGLRSSASIFTEIFARLIYCLVVKRSSLLCSTKKPKFKPDDTHCSSTDSEQKCMSRLYQNYASGLSLESSSTLMDSIVDTFGSISLGCFPVTMLMILYPTYEEADIAKFLSYCFASSSTEFQWLRSPYSCAGEGSSNTTDIIIAQKVELILHNEFPQIIHAIDQCQCSVLTLVMRWHSQHFWNYLDWENIVIYTYLIILYGVDFQVYVIVAILRHLEPTLRELTAKHSSQSLVPFLTLLREPIRDFRFSSWESYLLHLQNKDHNRHDELLSSPQ
ncbi:uncharacterized protein PHALS_01634 [Plasmopara halstedii]|uniref:BROMI C-terminal Rab TBC-like domain-containing protein n=1 Tax=Plasmopara halstedii TaxID=4781 RepID=A0A0P1AW60_PLAHL|nr:uncharacterized protein PHALS_01634 [Plasmopara halstedii]CEG45329.1 hypothetical protein PHALS_01634 [Plasmopara halstedii]|eukprot:XP_024581698.1 hypothetical protein PHALS_01634 [Plasmopara halstedii]